MIYEAQVAFKLLKALVFLPSEKQLQENVKYKLLISPQIERLTFIEQPNTPICRIYLGPCRVTLKSPTHCELTHYELIHDKQRDKQHQIVSVVEIISTENCIKHIQSVCSNRKYKSCLSFQPSHTRHVSILSGESPTQKYRGFINLVMIMFIVLNIRNIIDNFIRYGARFTSAPLQLMPLSSMLGFASLMLFVELAFRVDRLRFHKRLSDRIVRILLKVNQISVLVYIGLYCQKFINSSPIIGISFTMIGLVLFLKLVSYMQVNTQLRKLLDRSSSLAPAQFNDFVFANHQISQQNLKYLMQNRKNWQPLVSREKLYYFLIAPTLCYQLNYPRSPEIRTSWIIKRLVQLLVITLLLIVIWVQYMQPELDIWVKLQDQKKTFLMNLHRLMRLAVPNTIGWVLGFYSFFHLLLNIISELIRFADREFYKDWWNCRNLEEYWKTWNLPVHNFFVRHCYTPLLKKGWSKVGANILVFFLSALAHEYLVCVPLGVVSYYAFLAMLLQAPAIFIEKSLSKYLRLQDSELGNVSFWLFFCFIGQPVCMFIYYSLYVHNHPS